MFLSRWIPTASATLRGRLILLAAGGAVVFAGAFWVWDAVQFVRSDDARVRSAMVTVSADTAGRIIARPVTVGSVVTPRDLLAQLDDRESRLNLAAVTYQLEALETEIDSQRLEASITTSAGASRIGARKSGLAASAADLEAARALLASARAEHDRFSRLRQSGLVTQSAFERIATDMEQAVQVAARAQSAVEENRAGVSEASAQAATAKVLNRAADARAIAARALREELALHQLAVTRHAVSSPITGVVDEVFVERGEWVEPGARIALLHDPGDTWIDANIKETDIARIAPGAPVSVTFDAWPGRRFAGKVTLIRDAAAGEFAMLPVVNPTGVFTRVTQRVPVRILLEAGHPPLRPGALARVRISASGRNE